MIISSKMIGEMNSDRLKMIKNRCRTDRQLDKTFYTHFPFIMTCSFTQLTVEKLWQTETESFMEKAI